MKYNTTPIKNIDEEVYVGAYNGVTFELQPGETRYLPTIVSKHLAEHLANKIVMRIKKKENVAQDPQPIIEKILGKEIMTAPEHIKLSFAEEVKQHEKEFALWQEEQRKIDLLKRNEANEIAENTKKNV